MKVAIVGAGPAGLFLARLLRRRIPETEVCIYERNVLAAPAGFGVVFGGRSLDAIAAADPEVGRALSGAAIRWESMSMRHRGETIAWRGFGMSAISRRALLAILEEAAREVGAEIVADREADAWALGSSDLVVGADGVRSATRDGARDRFGATDQLGLARYIWLGATVAFDSMTFLFVRTEFGAFAAHAYPYEAGASTFLVETDDATWRRAGFAERSSPAGQSDDDAIATLQGIFASQLGGAGLVGDGSHWLRFRTIRNRRWSYDGRVLIGDAAHTAHFSLGSGTRMAMEDAIALTDALATAGQPSDAFGRYERERRPAVERLQSLADTSRRWWETYGERLDLDPVSLACNYVSRTGAVTIRDLRQRDPRFADLVESSHEPRSLPGPPVRILARPDPCGLASALDEAERERRRGRSVIVEARATDDEAQTAILAGRCDGFEFVATSPWFERLTHVMARLASAVDTAGEEAWTTSSDPDWSPAEIVAHVTEMLPYWARETTMVARASVDGKPFGRTHHDPDRLSAVDRGRTVERSVALRSAWDSLDEADRLLTTLSAAGRLRRGVHARRGLMSVDAIVEAFMVDHLEEHVEQLSTAIDVGAAASS